MTINAEFIDQIVKNVMREMQSRVSPVDGAPKVNKQPSVSAAVHTMLAVNGLVISESVLAGANAAGRTIALQSGAIVTPSGRDFIRKNSITLSTQIAGTGTTSAGGTMITIGSMSSLTTAASAAGWKTQAASTEAEAASMAAAKIADGAVTCFGGEPSVVACLLNRNSSVRAAVVSRATNFESLMTMMNPHVICLDSGSWSFGELLRLLKGFMVPSGAPKSWSELNPGGGR